MHTYSPMPFNTAALGRLGMGPASVPCEGKPILTITHSWVEFAPTTPVQRGLAL